MANLLSWISMIVHVKYCAKINKHPYEYIKSKIKRIEVALLVIFFVVSGWIFVTNLLSVLLQLFFECTHKKNGNVVSKEDGI